jgi:hypothetical protein
MSSEIKDELGKSEWEFNQNSLELVFFIYEKPKSLLFNFTSEKGDLLNY